MESSERQRISISEVNAHNAGHSIWKMSVIWITVIVFVVMIVFNGLAGVGGGVFTQSTGTVANKNYLEITPAGWTFSIWGFIYTWNALWLIYGVSTIFRKDADGIYIYKLTITPSVVYVVFIMNNLFNIAWLITWDREELVAALPLIALTPVTLYISLTFSHLYLNRNINILRKMNMEREIWLIRFLVQNGMAFYAAWVTVATLLNFSVVLTYCGDVSQPLSSTISLSILTVELVLWVVVDLIFLDNYTRYTFSPYITLVVALSGVINKNFDLDTAKQNSIFSLILLIFAVLLLVVKIFVLLWRHFNKVIVTPSVT